MTLNFQANDNDLVKVRLISEVRSLQPGYPFWIGIYFNIKKDWHIYWRNPGDSGLPVKVTWKLPEGFQADEILWPIPEVIKSPQLVNYGYKNNVLLLCKISPPATLTNTQVNLLAKVSWLVCKEACLPGEKEVKLTLTVKDQTPSFSEWKDIFDDIRKQLSQNIKDWHIEAKVDQNKIFLYLKKPDWFTKKLRTILFLPYDSNLIDHTAVQRISLDRGIYKLELKRSSYSNKTPQQIEGILISNYGWDKKGEIKALKINVQSKS